MTQEKPFKTYLCSYRYNNATWALDIKATDMDDAEARVRLLGDLKLDGELIATYPVSMGWWCKLSVAIRNFLWK